MLFEFAIFYFGGALALGLMHGTLAIHGMLDEMPLGYLVVMILLWPVMLPAAFLGAIGQPPFDDDDEDGLGY